MESPFYYTNMKNIIILFLGTISFFSCVKEDSSAYYFNQKQQDSLLVNIIKYVGENATYASDSTRFKPEFTLYYQSLLPKYQLVNLFKSPSGIYYFFLNRPVSTLLNYRRGVVGSFTLDRAGLFPKNFREIMNTPHLKDEMVMERGGFLFRELVKNGNIDAYLGMRDYVEWPDRTLKYEVKWNRWVYQRGINQ